MRNKFEDVVILRQVHRYEDKNDAVPEENMFACSPRKASFQASVLLALSKRPGQSEQSVCNLYRGCRMDVMKDAVEARGPRQSEDEAREEFLGKFPVQFLAVE